MELGFKNGNRQEAEADEAADQSLERVWFRLLDSRREPVARVYRLLYDIAPALALVAVDGGSGHCIIDGLPQLLEDGAAYLVMPGQRVELHFDTEGNRQLYELRFDLIGPEADCERSLEALRERGRLISSGDGIALSFCERIERHWHTGRTADRFVSHAAFQELLHSFFRQHDRNEDALEKVRACMLTRYREDVTIESLAELAGMSRYHFMRLFKMRFGQSAMDFLTELRTNEAKRLLEEGLAPGDVAEAVGYKDPLYFSSQFKKQVGIPPRTYYLNRQCKAAAYSWPNIGHLLTLRMIPFAAPIDQNWTDDYRRKYRFDVKVPLSHDYDFNRLALERARPDRIVALDELIPEQEKEKLRAIAPALFLRWHADDWRTHLRSTAAFLDREQEGERWLARYEEQAEAVRRRVPDAFRQGKLLLLTISPAGVRVWGRRAGTVLYDDLGLECAPGVESIEFMRELAAGDHLAMLKSFRADTILISVAKDRQSQQEWERLQRTSAWAGLNAVRNRNVHLASSQTWLREPYLEYTANRHEQLLQELDRLFCAL
ncbi:helix-turn-helix domain-containing protein [Cohnella fermenti]|uniref:Helix-turn-helix domain-containing protein n=1 Tax=Cohnella fermenti TaxID=2565925 RepID=A0A4V3WDR3_9BACL|nr:helix-turn-helix domain-containing protein [Cohnella fermenti]THF73262.1 helix-turn-helix domain-containing protein [Cohnella fermenti]